MASPHKTTRRKTTRRRSTPAAVGLVLLLILFTMLMGVGLAQALEPKTNPIVQTKPISPKNSEIGTVDPVSDRDRLGQELYLDSCKSCHLAIPPAVLPTQTWQILLQDPQHYGVTLDLPQGPEKKILWNYLRNSSRPIANKEERIPYRIADSRYFKALHPKVKLDTKAKLTTCISCHPSTADFNFRKLSSEAEKSN